MGAQVLGVVGGLLGVVQIVAPMHLGPAGEARGQRMHPWFAHRMQGLLVAQGRARAHQAHVTAHDAPQLGQFVQAGAAQPAAQRRQMAFRIGQQVSGHRGCAHPHAAELGHQKGLALPPDPGDQ
jgi:hypothetical protein